jgi:glycosyltransferase involved in cell wall biosynthesis
MQRPSTLRQSGLGFERETSTQVQAAAIRVLRLAPHFYRDGTWPVAFDPVGGMQNQVWQLSRDLDAAGIHQTIVTSHIPGSRRAYRAFESAMVRSIGPIVPAPLAAWLVNFSWFLSLMPYLARNLGRFDLVHVHFDHSIWCRLLAAVIKLSRTPLVISLNVSLLSDGAADKVAPDGLLGLRNWLERRALRTADRVVALSPRQAAIMARIAPGRRDRACIIPDTLDAGVFRTGVDAASVARFRAAHGIPADRPVVSYIGRISEEKGWRDLSWIAGRLIEQGVFVLICGDGPCRRRLERNLPANGDGRDWCVTGFVPRAEVKAALAITQVLMLPSRREAFGSILLEAMAWDVPSVGYRVGGSPDVAGDPPAFALVPAADREAFVAAVLRLLGDADGRRFLASRGRARVGDFSPDMARDRLLRLYRSLVRADAGGRGDA